MDDEMLFCGNVVCFIRLIGIVGITKIGSVRIKPVCSFSLELEICICMSGKFGIMKIGNVRV